VLLKEELQKLRVALVIDRKAAAAKLKFAVPGM
jgi:hypothetical protein